jgi:acetyltransferase-like isoleucine patch superfamily enzyme
MTEKARPNVIPEPSTLPSETQKLVETTPLVRDQAPSSVPVKNRLKIARFLQGVKQTLKWIGNGVGLVLVAIPAGLCRIESWFSERDDLFLFWGQFFALIPGSPGLFLRKCYYFLTLQRCSLNCHIGFLTYFAQRQAEVGARVYIGARASIGIATLGEGSLIGSRVSILNGGRQHQFGPDGRLTACRPSTLPRVYVGEETWIGEAAVLMADVGRQCIVAAGSVVSSPVPDGSIVGGNPARFAGKTIERHREALATPTKGPSQ